MPNLTLSYTGNMNITSAFISDDKVYLEYGLNTTGWITGVTYSVSKSTHWDEPDKFYPGDDFRVAYTPHWSGTTKTETITVTGVDEGGTQRSDTAVLKQAPLTKLTGTESYKPEYGNIQEFDHRIRDDGTLSFEGRIDGQPGETFLLDGTVVGYEGYEYGCLIPLFEGVISPLPVPITSLTLNVDSQIVDSGVATVSFEPESADTMNIAYSSSDTSKAVIDTSGNITVYSTGEVTICARDMVSGLEDCKTIWVVATSQYVKLVYNVTSTTEPTKVFSVDSCCDDRWSDFADDIFYNGEEVSSLESEKYFTFPELGEQELFVNFKTFGEQYALANCVLRSVGSLVKVVFPDNDRIQSTGNYAFIDCTNLREVIMPRVKYINYAAFYGCTSLSSITIPNVEYIGETSLNHTTSLVSINAPKVKNIMSMGLANTTSLKYAYFPLLETIGDLSISGSSIEELVIGPNLTQISLRDATRLRNLTLEGSTPPSQLSYAFNNIGNLFNIWVPSGAVETYKSSFPSAWSGYIRSKDTVETASTVVVYQLENNLGSGVTQILGSKHPSVVSVTDTNGNELILDARNQNQNRIFYTFSQTTGYTTVIFTLDKGYAAQNGLGSLFAGSDVAQVNFNGYDGTIPSLSMYSSPFIEELVLPSGMTSIPNQMCRYCRKLVSVTIPNGVTSIGDYAFDYCSSLGIINFGNTVATIGQFAFSNAGQTGSTINIPDSVTTIGRKAFQSAGFYYYVIGTGITSIGDLAFVRDNWNGNFYEYVENHSTRSITMLATTPPAIGTHTIYGSYSSEHFPVYVPCQSLSAYQSASNYLPTSRISCIVE